LGPWEDRRAAGKAVRSRVPREAHAEWQAPADRPDPVSALLASNEGRQSELLPLRMGRMADSPFGFLRGSAVVLIVLHIFSPIARAERAPSDGKITHPLQADPHCLWTGRAIVFAIKVAA
jgi:hypothetical protein